MEGINRVPADMIQMIPSFQGDIRELAGYINKCEYIISKYAGGGRTERVFISRDNQ